jgi:N-acetylmuramoyl-L-alanine amidase
MVKINQPKKLTFCLLILLIGISGCGRKPIQPKIYTKTKPKTSVKPTVAKVLSKPFSSQLRCDVTHVVAPGETVWRLGKMYDVGIDDIVDENNLSNARQLEMGQRLRIPDAAPLKPVIPLYDSNKWKYIIIHHSATDEGNALAFNISHKNRGFHGLGYHFVIDNGTKGKQDGQIEVSPRWIKQKRGAHCKAAKMNYKSIGVCLVGDFTYEKMSSKQMRSLVFLVNKLRKYYKVPVKNIIRHGHVKGARTACPGKRFPWDEFLRRLRK